VLDDRLAALQAEQLQLADDVWNSTTPDQRAQLPGLVRRQGPTSAVLSLAHALGFDYDTMSASYPMLGMRPMRDRLELTPDQQSALDKLREQTAARRRAAPGQPLDDEDRAAIETILTPAQRAQLTDANFRRQVVLALNYPEKRGEVGITADQLAAWEALADQARTRLHAVDRQMLDDVLEIVPPKQREQLTELIEQDAAP
jgi:hypothetical protein